MWNTWESISKNKCCKWPPCLCPTQTYYIILPIPTFCAVVGVQRLQSLNAHIFSGSYSTHITISILQIKPLRHSQFNPFTPDPKWLKSNFFFLRTKARGLFCIQLSYIGSPLNSRMKKQWTKIPKLWFSLFLPVTLVTNKWL